MYQKNPLLFEARLSYFKDEFNAESDKDYDEKHMHDMLDHKVELLPETNELYNDLKKLSEELFPYLSDHDGLSVQRVFKIVDKSGDHIVEFAYGCNGGIPKELDDDKEKAFDQKWIHYVKQIHMMMQSMYDHGYVRPALVWIEDPNHSDCYSCYIKFKK